MAQIPYGKIIRRTWRRDNFRELGPVKRDLLTYLWTGPEGSAIPALYFITYGTMATDLGHTEKKIKQLMKELVAAGFCKYDERVSVIFFQKQIIVDEPSNANVVVGWLKRLSELPETPLKSEFLEVLQPYVAHWDIRVSKYYKESLQTSVTLREGLGEGLPEGLPKPFRKGYPNPSRLLFPNQNHNQEPKERKEGSAAVAASPPALPLDESEKEAGKAESRTFDPYKDLFEYAQKNKEKIYSNVLQKIHYAELGTPDQLWSKIVWGTMVAWIRENQEQARSALSGNFKNSWIAYIDWWVRNDWLRNRAAIDKTRGLSAAEEKKHFENKQLTRGGGGDAVLLGQILKPAKGGE